MIHSLNITGITGMFRQILLSIWLISSSTVGASELQCDLGKNSHIDPTKVASMIDAAKKGYLYSVDTRTSNIEFQVNHFPFSSVQGQFHRFQGGLALPAAEDQPQQPQSKQALFLIKVDSVTTGDDELDDYLKGSVFFDVMRYPDILFVSTGVEWLDDSTVRLPGELTLRGTTRSIVFFAHVDRSEQAANDSKQKILIAASAEIQRSDYGMDQMQFFISDTVRFNLNIEASKVGIY